MYQALGTHRAEKETKDTRACRAMIELEMEVLFLDQMDYDFHYVVPPPRTLKITFTRCSITFLW